jgi:alkaline phosphatase D
MGLTGSWDGRISRRTLLRTGGSAAAGLFIVGSTAPRANAVPAFRGDPFSLGIASGDPTPTSVVLWTRLAPEPLVDGGGVPALVYGVRYEVAEDEAFSRIVRRGSIEAVPEESHTVHAEVTGLQPQREYWYRFKWGTSLSAVGRTRTAPPLDSTPTSMRFAFVSCQNFTNGHYLAYRDLIEQDLELVIHLGDYIYEGPGTGFTVRKHLPAGEIRTLNGYRTRHALYKTDLDLQAAHARFPWLMTWDDHEFDNNYANLDLDPDEPLETAAERRAAAYLAYWEHAPLSRSRKPVGSDMNLYRRVLWGRLASFHVLDTRQYRADQIAQCTQAEREPVSGYCPRALLPEREMLGEAQRTWLFDGLLATPSTGWNVIANQVGFAPEDELLDDRRRWGLDSWDGYVAERQRVLDFLKAKPIRNTVVITGDKHQHSARNVPQSYLDVAGPSLATEFVGSSITTEGNGLPGIEPGDPGSNPHIKFDCYQRGYVQVELTSTVWRSDFRVLDKVETEDGLPTWLTSAVVENGKPEVVWPTSTPPV